MGFERVYLLLGGVVEEFALLNRPLHGGKRSSGVQIKQKSIVYFSTVGGLFKQPTIMMDDRRISWEPSRPSPSPDGGI
jgi:hypothetical protein